jgi:hypothetical protein
LNILSSLPFSQQPAIRAFILYPIQRLTVLTLKENFLQNIRVGKLVYLYLFFFFSFFFFFMGAEPGLCGL